MFRSFEQDIFSSPATLQIYYIKWVGNNRRYEVPEVLIIGALHKMAYEMEDFIPDTGDIFFRHVETDFGAHLERCVARR